MRWEELEIHRFCGRKPSESCAHPKSHSLMYNAITSSPIQIPLSRIVAYSFITMLAVLVVRQVERSTVLLYLCPRKVTNVRWVCQYELFRLKCDWVGLSNAPLHPSLSSSSPSPFQPPAAPLQMPMPMELPVTKHLCSQQIKFCLQTSNPIWSNLLLHPPCWRWMFE